MFPVLAVPLKDHVPCNQSMAGREKISVQWDLKMQVSGLTETDPNCTTNDCQTVRYTIGTLLTRTLASRSTDIFETSARGIGNQVKITSVKGYNTEQH